MPQTLTLLDENYKEVTYNNGEIPAKLRRKVGGKELYFLAYESLERIRKFITDNTVSTITWTPTPDKTFIAGSPTNWSGKYIENPTKPQKLDFVVMSGYRPVGTPDDYKLSDAERLKKYGVDTQHYLKWKEKQGGNGAAEPGTSNHGFGIAIDIYSASKPATTGKGKTKTCIQPNVVATIVKWDNGNDRFKGYGEWQDCFQAWLYLHGREYGWIPRLYPSFNPALKSPIEPWHFEYDYKSDIYLNKSQATRPEGLVAEKDKKIDSKELAKTSDWQIKIEPTKTPVTQNIETGVYQKAINTVSSTINAFTDFFK